MPTYELNRSESESRLIRLDQSDIPDDLEEYEFDKLELNERRDLQEWIVKDPDVLGESLLIIQKEFDRFRGTKIRLDVLAVDKDGNLVVIENKIKPDDRLVMGQALNYAAYCSELNKEDIIEIYKDYLYCWEGKENAKTKLCEFFAPKSLEEVKLNPKKTPRILLVATEFCEEVKSSVYWLRNSFGMQVQCISVIAKVRKSDKKCSKVYIQIELVCTERLRRPIINKYPNQERRDRMLFWTRMQDRLSQDKTKWPQKNPSIKGRQKNRLDYDTEVDDCAFQLKLLISSEGKIGIELNIWRDICEENKRLYNSLERDKKIFVRGFDDDLDWQPCPQQKGCKVVYKSQESYNSFRRENWQDIIDWFYKYLNKFDTMFSKPLYDAYKNEIISDR